jgi:iron complex transport system substrate-binding protein
MKKSHGKLAVTIVMILLGASLAVLATPVTSSGESGDGVIIDFGDYDISYTSTNGSDYDAFSALEYACSTEGYDLVVDGYTVVTIDSMPSEGSTVTWALYITVIGETEWTEYTGDPTEIEIGDYSAVAWGLCAEGEEPTTAVDATGYCYYGYGQAERVVTLAPSCTETACADGATSIIVGTDKYSNYPASVVEGQDDGSIAIVGSYTDPSYELIIQQDPDLVICIASQSGQLAVAEKLRAAGIHVVVTYDGEDIDTIFNNPYIVGIGIGYDISTKSTLAALSEGMDTLADLLENCSFASKPTVMVSLSTAKSPWVSGSNTYISDILDFDYCVNVYYTEDGWVMVNSETIAEYNPSYIIIVNSEYPATEAGYNEMLASMSAEWKSTDAYKNGNIYLFTESAADLASRSSTRIAQLTELTARIIQPDSFDDGIIVPKYIGDDYTDYLTYTKGLGFNY